MNNSTQFDWIPFYESFADCLLKYKDEREVLISKLVEAYDSINMPLPKLDSTPIPQDIDPFTIFGLFNKGITDSNRIKIINAFAKVFNINESSPKDFDGIPVLNNLNATFYRFINDEERKDNDIDGLWALFEVALAYADASDANKSRFIEAFNDVKDLKGNRWKLTMGLYWVRPYSFMNLDSRNRWYIEDRLVLSQGIHDEVANLGNTLPSGDVYLKVCEDFTKAASANKYGFNSLPQLSYDAWIISEQVNKENKEAKEQAETQNSDMILSDAKKHSPRYWLYAPGEKASKWDEFYDAGIMAIGWSDLGDLSAFPSKESMKEAMRGIYDPDKTFKNDGHTTWQFANEIKPGDIVFVKKGLHSIIGRGIVSSEYRYDPDESYDYPNIYDVDWTDRGEWDHPWHQVAMKTLTDLTPYTNYVTNLNSLFDEDESQDEESIIQYDPYTKKDFLNQVFMTESDYGALAALLKDKKNVVLQGAPGVGKTYAAKRLAYALMGESDSSRVTMVQFHQSYSYEDFIEGYRPKGNSFDLKKGSFYEFCKMAEVDNERDYFFIIDEINRGNLSKIFGELFMLIEADKRGTELRLLYSNEKFNIPKNVHIIGTMNTADRSLAMIDYALRRRFAFFDIKPGFTSNGFSAYQKDLSNPKLDKLVSEIVSLNSEISEDDSLGEGFMIGHSYLCNLSSDSDDAALARIVEYEIVPLIKEYWYDDPQQVDKWSGRLKATIQ